MDEIISWLPPNTRLENTPSAGRALTLTKDTKANQVVLMTRPILYNQAMTCFLNLQGITALERVECMCDGQTASKANQKMASNPVDIDIHTTGTINPGMAGMDDMDDEYERFIFKCVQLWINFPGKEFKWLNCLETHFQEMKDYDMTRLTEWVKLGVKIARILNHMDFKRVVLLVVTTGAMLSACSYTWCNEQCEIMGMAFDFVIAYTLHDCDPNCMMFVDGLGVMRLWALRDIPAGEPLTISYVLLGHDQATRHALLKQDYRFDCKCTVEYPQDRFIGISDELSFQKCIKLGLPLCCIGARVSLVKAVDEKLDQKNPVEAFMLMWIFVSQSEAPLCASSQNCVYPDLYHNLMIMVQLGMDALVLEKCQGFECILLRILDYLIKTNLSISGSNKKTYFQLQFVRVHQYLNVDTTRYQEQADNMLDKFRYLYDCPEFPDAGIINSLFESC